jgi:hypothetical protein
MMVPLYITSVQRGAGKNLIAMGMIHRLKKDGFKVGYFKPLGHFPVKLKTLVIDEGAQLFHRLFALDDAMEDICPVVVTQDLVVENYKKDVKGLRDKIEKSFQRVSADKDVVIVSSDINFSEGSSFGLSGLQVIKMLHARTLFVENYGCEYCVDFVLELKRILGNPMIGIVFNKVGTVQLEEMKALVSPFLHRKNIVVFGFFPNDPVLGSTSVRDLVDHLMADVVCGGERLTTQVERFLVGGMQVDKFITYLLKSNAPAVIVGGDRTDIQLVAIENDVRCLILTGSLYPNETIVSRAEAKSVPILVARDDTYTVAKKVDALVGKFRMEEREKIDYGIKLVNEQLDFEKLYETLALPQ